MITTLVFCVLAILDVGGTTAPALKTAIQGTGFASALVVASQAVDEHPVWSPDGRFLGVNVDGRWSKLDLGSVSLHKNTWHGGEGIGVADPPPALVPIPEAQVREWEKAAKFGPRTVTTRAGTTVELEQDGLGTVFRITNKGGKPREPWKTTLENCHGLALSRDESLVAFVCELSGVVVALVDP